MWTSKCRSQGSKAFFAIILQLTMGLEVCVDLGDKLLLRSFTTLLRLAALLVAFSVITAFPATGQPGGSACSHLHRLTRVLDVRQLDPDVAQCAFPVKIRGVVTALSGWKNSFFLQDASGAVSVDRLDHAEVHSGHEVIVTGVTGPGSFAPIVIASAVEIVGHKKLPPAKQIDHAVLASGAADSEWVEVRGIVQAASIVEKWGRPVLFLTLNSNGISLTVHVLDFPKDGFNKLVDASVRIQGVGGAVFNEKRQLMGVRLFTPSLAYVRASRLPASDPFAAPELQVDRLFQFGTYKYLPHRIKLQATVAYRDDTNVFLQSKGQPLIAHSSKTIPAPGSRVEVVGFVVPGQYPVTLAEALFRKVGDDTLPLPIAVTAGNVIQHRDGFVFAPYTGLLVSIEGVLLEKVQQNSAQTWLLRDDRQIFQIQINDPAQVERFAYIREGSLLKVTGICTTEINNEKEPTSFGIVLASGSDISVLKTPFWNARKSFLFTTLLAVFFLAICWALMQTRKLLRLMKEDQGVKSAISTSKLQRGARLAGVLCATSALIVLIGGWGFHISTLRTLLPGYPPMYPNAALGLFCAGCALGVNRTRSRYHSAFVYLCALTSAVVGMLTLAEFVFGVNLQIDEALFKDVTVSAVSMHGRMAPATAISLAFAGFSLLLIHRRHWTAVSQLLACATATLCLLNALGHLYGVHEIFAFGSHIGMAVPTILSFFLLCAGILLAEPDNGIVKVITTDAPGGIMARWLLPSSVIVCVLLSWLRWYAQFKLHYFDTTVGLALFACSNIVVFVFLLWTCASLLNRSDAARERMRQAANHDILTTLFNRKGIMDLLERELFRCSRERMPISIIMADADHFKAVNDTLGHSAGDEVLKEIALRLKSGLREYDGVGRIGGEEFLLVLPGCDLGGAILRADQLRQLVSKTPIQLPGGQHPVTISLGVASSLRGETTLSTTLITQADEALYHAKDLGRNRVQSFASPGVAVL